MNKRLRKKATKKSVVKALRDLGIFDPNATDSQIFDYVTRVCRSDISSALVKTSTLEKEGES